jgi:NADH dehydrogenase [ubiquinone] 1 alpha subcomplex assembly factor 7
MSDLQKRIFEHIKQNGPITVDHYLNMALYDPKDGYYFKEGIIGRNGDFITSPEITQIFGELIAIFIIDQWSNIDSTYDLHIIECGPGRGTLIYDILTTLKQYNIVYERTHIHLVEISPYLKKIQQEKLKNYQNIQWYTSLDDVPKGNGYTFILANEFFDALPIKQYSGHGKQKQERLVHIDTQNNLAFSCTDSDIIHEICPTYKTIMDYINLRLHNAPGSVLIIDYGDEAESRKISTLQAVRNHKLTNIFDEPGEVDISHQVNFNALGDLIDPSMLCYPLITQGNFLKQLGIDLRLQQLLPGASPEQRMQLLSACARLTSPQHMGEIFKVFYAASRCSK